MMMMATQHAGKCIFSIKPGMAKRNGPTRTFICPLSPRGDPLIFSPDLSKSLPQEDDLPFIKFRARAEQKDKDEVPRDAAVPKFSQFLFHTVAIDHSSFVSQDNDPSSNSPSHL